MGLPCIHCLAPEWCHFPNMVPELVIVGWMSWLMMKLSDLIEISQTYRKQSYVIIYPCPNPRWNIIWILTHIGLVTPYSILGLGQHSLSHGLMADTWTNVTLWSARSCGINLTHWGQDKMAAIFQTTFWNALSWMNVYRFLLRFHWSLFPGVQITIFQHWFRWWLGASQVTSLYLSQWWLVYWHIYASLIPNELIMRRSSSSAPVTYWCSYWLSPETVYFPHMAQGPDLVGWMDQLMMKTSDVIKISQGKRGQHGIWGLSAIWPALPSIHMGNIVRCLTL